MVLTVPHLLQRIARSVRTNRSPAHRRGAYRPRLEVLEDRSVPSTLTITSSGDDGNQAHTLRYAVAHAQSGDTILLTAAVKSPIVLTQGELVLSKNVTIEGARPARGSSWRPAVTASVSVARFRHAASRSRPQPPAPTVSPAAPVRVLPGRAGGQIAGMDHIPFRGRPRGVAGRWRQVSFIGA
jgi:hypothetical protein